jgi:hypothetical protein
LYCTATLLSTFSLKRKSFGKLVERQKDEKKEKHFDIERGKM